jgi:hypothetical protein
MKREELLLLLWLVKMITLSFWSLPIGNRITDAGS